MLRALPAVMAIVLALTGTAFAQGHPTGSIRGRVTGPDGSALAGAEVRVTSRVLPGAQAAVTSVNGDFIIPFLPPGEYTVTFSLEGFATQSRIIRVTMAEMQPLTIELALAGVVDAVNVTGGGAGEISSALTITHTYKASSIEHLPVGRTVYDAVLLAPGVTPNGPNNRLIISGALSYEGLFLLNGVVFNAGVVAAPLPLYIEDAIQETSVATGNISAEYGRFQGGVVNVVTKSGGNVFSGSFRTNLTNEAWRALTPHPADQRTDALTPAFELTAGGPLRKDTTWFFAAGRFDDQRKTLALPYTGTSYLASTLDTRGEGKLTHRWKARHTIRGSYIRRLLRLDNTRFGPAMDLASLYDDRTDFELSAIDYTGILTPGFFVEGQFSQKRDSNTDRGARFTDLIKGTPILDASRGLARFNSAPFCAVCGEGWLERNENRDWFAKVNYFLSTSKAGSHHIVAGIDSYEERRRHNNWQSGSGFEIEASSTWLESGAIYPVFNSNTNIIHRPLVAESLGNSIRTYSYFVNDMWRYNDRLTMNAGSRYDVNRSRDQAGLPVVKDGIFSPRLGVSWRLTESGTWIANAGLARYVAAVNTLFIDVASAAGRTAAYTYAYEGSNINAAAPLISAEPALNMLFEWFRTNDGLNRPTRTPPVIPGKTRRIGADSRAPHAQEYSAGIAHEMGSHGAWRVDVLARSYHDLYGEFVDATTGRYVDERGREYDLAIVTNDPAAKRQYKGISASVTSQAGSAHFGATYTLSRSRGNVDGEGPSTASFRTTIGTYPEYRESRWNSPMGYTRDDQRHKVRAWMSVGLPPTRVGQFNVGVLQRFDSALPYDATGPVNPRPGVSNAPRYITPPSQVTYYFSPRYALRWHDAWNTDVAVTWSKNVASVRTELFFRGVVTNLFNNSAVLTGDTTILTAARPGLLLDLQPFNPFRDTPQSGIHWAPGPNFGQPTAPASYQAPRVFSCSAGIRF